MCSYFVSVDMSLHHINVDGGDTAELDIFEIFPSAMTCSGLYGFMLLYIMLEASR